jgi:hypothetical protein
VNVVNMVNVAGHAMSYATPKPGQPEPSGQEGLADVRVIRALLESAEPACFLATDENHSAAGFESGNFKEASCETSCTRKSRRARSGVVIVPRTLTDAHEKFTAWRSR